MSYLSVVIVTKNRALELSQCLGSLLSGNSLPNEIIVIDNNSKDATKQLIAGLKIQSKVNVKYFNFQGKGYPKIYNKGLHEARNEWVAFIDDDCVASINWVDEIKKSIKKHPEVSAIMGWCGTYYSKNVYSQATLMFDNDWKQRSLNGVNVVDLEVLDNKNIVYKKSFLQKKSLKYDENRVGYENGAAEDCDLGMQIQEAGGQAICNKKMIVWHKDPQDWLWFMKKNIASWKAYQSLGIKWDLQEREKLKSKPIYLMELVREFKNNFNLSQIEYLQLFLVSKQVMILNRFLSHLIN
ncbi:MAG: glycosyltransferase family 2 protein [Candidatus Pacebacteria bacterium]|nr:glycosyltransferase family 2 protein [Candidatus Paceibacterota bacterium]NCS86553.1 glycosyltransferase family 2 protein [Candidatus Paceibacterota bacterium]PJC43398.1 MAG: hypothetical protein CO039_04125 [Candidatus Pacebacteria bacterium CG_4_9_14_0_2_um_filter_34_50]